MNDTTTWRIDPAHTDIAFSAKHMMVTTVRGKFDQVEGELRLDESDPTAASGEIRIAAASLSTGFDAAIRPPLGYFFAPGPWIVACVTKVDRAADYRVTADVTIRGQPAGCVRRRVQRDRPTGCGGRTPGPISAPVDGRSGVSTGTSPSRPAAGSSARVALDIDIAVDELPRGPGRAAEPPPDRSGVRRPGVGR